MSDKDTRELSRELESLKETLTDNKPAQIPLLDDVVDEENAPLDPSPPKKPPYIKKVNKQRPEDTAPPPDTRDLFEPGVGQTTEDRSSVSPTPAYPTSGQTTGAAEETHRLREEANQIAEAWLRESADKVADSYLREQADKMVEELVAEYSTEILIRLKERLTSQLYAILEDLDARNDEDKP